MEFEWDEAKRTANLAKHGVDFGQSTKFEFDSAVIVEDRRRDYGETRYRAWGLIGGELHHLAYTPRDGRLRVISLRRASRAEIRDYATQRPAR